MNVATVHFCCITHTHTPTEARMQTHTHTLPLSWRQRLFVPTSRPGSVLLNHCIIRPPAFKLSHFQPYIYVFVVSRTYVYVTYSSTVAASVIYDHFRRNLSGLTKQGLQNNTVGKLRCMFRGYWTWTCFSNKEKCIAPKSIFSTYIFHSFSERKNAENRVHRNVT